MGESRKCTIDKFKGDSLDSVSFKPSRSSFLKKSETFHSRRLSGSWLLYKYIEGGASNSLDASVRNPNKVVVTIDARTTEILTANKVASYLLGIKEKTVNKTRLCDFILSREDQCFFTETDLEPSGELVLFSGKVMDLVSPTKETIPVSVWARQLYTDEDPRCLVVMEPVERVTGLVKFDLLGRIINCDQSFATLYGYLEPESMKDLDIKDLIPSIELDPENNHGELVPKEGIKLCATGKMKDGSHFPLSIKIRPCTRSYGTLMKEQKQGERTESKDITYEGTVWVFNNISGMITLLPDGTIHSCNTNFSLILFGYSQNELVGKNISFLIPSFYEDLEFLDTDSMALPPFDDDDDSNAKCCCASDGRTTADSIGTDPPRPMNPLGKHIELLVDDAVESMQNLAFSPSPSENQVPFYCSELSPLSKETSPFSASKLPNSKSSEKMAGGDYARNEELSESSQYENSSKHLSYSESQDTLHSCTDSITESDVNANVLELSEYEECPKSVSASKIPREKLDKECDDCASYFSDSSDSEESYSSLAEDFNIQNTRLDSLSHESVNGFPTHAANSLESKVSTCEMQDSPVNSRYSEFNSNCIPFSMKVSTPKEQYRTTSVPINDDSYQSLPEGGFYGIGRHKDGSDLAIEYYIKKIVLDDGKILYCLWVSRDPEEYKECSPAPNYTMNHSETNKMNRTRTEESETTSSSCSSIVSDSFYTAGNFSDNYTVLEQIGKGAFGCVKKAYRNTDGLLVITKFIRKSEVYKELWVYDNKQNRKVPLEISLLTTIQHPNIVKVLDVFENDNCFQMVMEKHGSGMDLFEFIERDPNMDEPLASYIFRQVVSALNYLHNLFILHRDIKDENIILDENFHVKLIDFGSATFMGEQLFSTFCGTMEYCSPEVIQGNKYRGPELEMWSLGVTLYTLIFGENPFIDVDETLKGEFVMPHEVSKDLSNLIHHLLELDPVKRCTLMEVVLHPWVNQSVNLDNYKFPEVVNASADEINPPKYVGFFEEENLVLDSTYSDSSTEMKKPTCVEQATQPCSSTESEIDSLS
ncbi:PAS domain-containing serine/threonine-protein kinase-like isoform X2 [Stegodyphus dumicola]|nr:PAS domain-containing serine/threonine-protein kinase-like isoform X2 [Stegodyphus dumicola]